jgi:hypothetical protein
VPRPHFNRRLAFVVVVVQCVAGQVGDSPGQNVFLGRGAPGGPRGGGGGGGGLKGQKRFNEPTSDSYPQDSESTIEVIVDQ